MQVIKIHKRSVDKLLAGGQPEWSQGNQPGDCISNISRMRWPTPEIVQ